MPQITKEQSLKNIWMMLFSNIDDMKEKIIAKPARS